MRRLVTLAVVAILTLPTAASGQYTFGDWARDQGYSPGDVMPELVDASNSSPAVDSLNGIGDFDWTTTPTIQLDLSRNQISSIEPGDFSGLTNLVELELYRNQISSIESGDFSGLTNLRELSLSSNQLSSIESGDFSELTNLRQLQLDDNQLSSIEPGAFSGLAQLRDFFFSGNSVLTELNLERADFSSLTYFYVRGNVNITSVSLRNAVVNQTSLGVLLDGGKSPFGIGQLDGVTEIDLSGVDFANITDLSPLYVMDDLADLWLVDTRDLNAAILDALLDNLATIEGTDTEGILHMTQANFDAFDTAGGGLLTAWNAEPGHHVELVFVPLPGDVNLDGEVNGLDVDPFVDVLLSGTDDNATRVMADMNSDGEVNGLDVNPFIGAVIGGGTQRIPEPSTLLLCIIALGVVGGWRKWGG